MKYIDSHTHLYLPEFASDIDAVMLRAHAAGVKKIYFPAIDSSHTNEMLLLEERYPDICFAMMGLHPCSVNENYLTELKHAEEWITKRKFAAIGEIGLDFYWDKTHIQQQMDAFRIQMQWALDFNMPIVIHTRNAMQETIDEVQPFAAKGLKGIFHCFSGNSQQAKAIIDMGFYLGIGGVFTYKNAGLAMELEDIDVNWMVLETDAPYLTPVPFRGKRNETAYITYIAAKLAEAKKISIEEVARITTLNAEKIFCK